MNATKKSKTRELYDKSIAWIKRRGFSKLKANVESESLEKPTSFSRQREDQTITPDLTAVRRGRKSYFEIAIKSENEQRVVSKWKLLSRLAGLKNGKFYLLAPHGHRTFASKLVKRYGINAEVVNI